MEKKKREDRKKRSVTLIEQNDDEERWKEAIQQASKTRQAKLKIPNNDMPITINC